jgi:hypothetical protein
VTSFSALMQNEIDALLAFEPGPTCNTILIALDLVQPAAEAGPHDTKATAIFMLTPLGRQVRDMHRTKAAMEGET